MMGLFPQLHSLLKLRWLHPGPGLQPITQVNHAVKQLLEGGVGGSVLAHPQREHGGGKARPVGEQHHPLACDLLCSLVAGIMYMCITGRQMTMYFLKTWVRI